MRYFAGNVPRQESTCPFLDINGNFIPDRCDNKHSIKFRRTIELSYGEFQLVRSGPLEPEMEKFPADWRTAILRIDKMDGALADPHNAPF